MKEAVGTVSRSRGTSILVVAWVSVYLGACGGRSEAGGEVGPGVPECVPGRESPCACRNGRSGAQTCLADGTYASCVCVGSDTPSRGGSGNAGAYGGGTSGGYGGTATGGTSRGGTANGGAGGGKGGSAGEGGSVTGVEISSGPSKLVDVFVGEQGIYVVLTDQVLLKDRDGSELESVDAPREITSAAFDGERLIVADRARLTIYDPGLVELETVDLAEPCASSVLVGGGRFVCGPSNDWDRVFYTYDGTTGELLASSDQYTYNGIPMRRVPGTNDFVTVTTNSSPSDFHLYSVATSDEAVFVNESPYHGDFRVTNVYAFFGFPATHLVTDAGLMLKIYGEGCSADENSFTSQCFVKDGELGTLSGAQLFVAMDWGADGKLYGVVDPSPGFGSDGQCAESCILERIDVEDRVVEAQAVVHLTVGSFAALRYDPTSGALVVGYHLSYQYFDDDPYLGHRVELTAIP